MTQELLVPAPPIVRTTVPCASCGQPGPVEQMTAGGGERYYCGRIDAPEYFPLIRACEDRQRAALRSARLDRLVQAAEAVPLDEPATAGPDANEPATENAPEPASDTDPEPAAEVAEAAS